LKLLILLTTSFPLGSGEDFIPAELARAFGFDRILVCPCSPQKGAVQTKSLPEGCELVQLPRRSLGRSAYMRLLLRSDVRAEISLLAKEGQLNGERTHELLFFAKNAVEIAAALTETISVRPGDEVVLYSYWLYDAAAAGVRFADSLRKQGVTVRQISRAHGFDIHPERRKSGYLPMRRYLFHHLDRICPCSEDGAVVLRQQAGPDAGKIACAYLGTNDNGIGQHSREPFRLLSCSYLVPVKRIHLLIAALQQTDFPVVWTHIGSGPLENELQAEAEKLPPNVTVQFLGQKTNAEVLAYYREHAVSVFVNVSSSEGIPVTIMEAASFGTPVVATDVGGTHEIVKNGENGFLLPADFTPQALLAALQKMRNMDAEAYDGFCRNARKIWAEKFSAEKNYHAFYSALNGGNTL
jgi:glycosyltransferase involved in cell wall biosynthesis